MTNVDLIPLPRSVTQRETIDNLVEHGKLVVRQSREKQSFRILSVNLVLG